MTIPFIFSRGGFMNKILIIEDEKELHEVIELYLEDMNLEITCAHCSHEARDLFRRTDYSLVLCDVYLGEGVSGIDLMHEIMNIRPTVKFILSSAFIPQLNTEYIGVNYKVSYLPKPFEEQEIRSLVSELLNSG